MKFYTLCALSIIVYGYTAGSAFAQQQCYEPGDIAIVDIPVGHLDAFFSEMGGFGGPGNSYANAYQFDFFNQNSGDIPLCYCSTQGTVGGCFGDIKSISFVGGESVLPKRYGVGCPDTPITESGLITGVSHAGNYTVRMEIVVPENAPSDASQTIGLKVFATSQTNGELFHDRTRAASFRTCSDPGPQGQVPSSPQDIGLSSPQCSQNRWIVATTTVSGAESYHWTGYNGSQHSFTTPIGPALTPNWYYLCVTANNEFGSSEPYCDWLNVPELGMTCGNGW